ncbi:aminotransferase class I/II-fold pyridoxal phosphate-dependent enzyme [Nitriliruptor alkaliphilus]|uniref:aminotransferase class I/II-fold pyridoxal phosphate-dependent enzyme n=1 Tax=Nitriliruptor alkaliphilus TaxID=427918 RepID=UPI0006991C4E
MEASPTLAVDAKAKALKAAGEPVIGFGAGEPDFPTPANIVEAAQRAAADPATHRYSPAAGLPALREAIAAKTLRDTGFEVAPDQVTVTNGGKHALYNVFQALVDPGDEVLIPAPYWVSYPAQVLLADGVPVAVPTTKETGFRTSVEQLEEHRTDRTKILVFVSPSNPTGAVYPADEVAAIGAWAAEHGIWVITDEIYEHLIYGDATMTSLPVIAPQAAPRTIVVNGVAKTYAMTGWRVGWSICPLEIAKGINKLQSQITSNVANVAQFAALEALGGSQDAVAEMRAAFDRRRKLAVAELSAIDGVDVVEPEGAFYVFPSFEGVLGREIAGRTVSSTLELAEVLLEQVNVALVPGEAFGAPGYARLSYALGDDDLAEGIARIAGFLGG